MRIRDWSSDVCSSDLEGVERQLGAGGDAGDQQGDDEKAANRPQEMPEECRRRRRRTTDLRGGERVEEALEEGVHAGAGLWLSVLIGSASCRERVGQYG